MPNWAEGNIRFRGNTNKIMEFLENEIECTATNKDLEVVSFKPVIEWNEIDEITFTEPEEAKKASKDPSEVILQNDESEDFSVAIESKDDVLSEDMSVAVREIDQGDKKQKKEYEARRTLKYTEYLKKRRKRS